MPYITTDKINVVSHDLIGVENKGDKKLFHHVQNVTPEMEFCHQMREAPGNGFSKGRQQRQIGHIPEMLFLEHPEWVKDPRTLAKWLTTEEGKPFCTVKGGI